MFGILYVLCKLTSQVSG